MALFSKETDSGMLNVHEMQTMWFEYNCGLAHYRKGEYRQALKMFGYIQTHLSMMSGDCDEFQHFAHRKGMLTHFTQMLQFQNDIYRGKWPVRGCLNLLKTLSKIWKQDLDLKEIQKEFDEYTDTPEYAKWLKESENNEDTNEISNDKDP